MSSQDRMAIEEISKILGISVNTLQRRAWRQRAGCPIKKIGRYFRLLYYMPRSALYP